MRPDLFPESPFVVTAVGHGGLRVAWAVRLHGAGQPAPGFEQQPCGRLLLVSVRSPAASGLLNARAHGGTPFYGLVFQLAGQQRVRDAAFECMLRPGDVLLWHSSDSGSFEVSDGFHALQMLAPADVFERLWPRLADCQGPRCLPGGHALAAMAQASVQALWLRRTQCGADELGAAAMAVVDLVGKCRGALLAPTRAGARRPLFQDILAYIEQELDNPVLTPALLADRHGCSVRTLHALFARHQQTVVGLIRQRRLERCREALGHGCGDERISDVALQWGFCDAAHFSKTFKAAYGVSPRQYRMRQLLAVT